MKLSKPRYVETSGNTMHPIEHVGNLILSMDDGNYRYLADVLHVQFIIKHIWFWLGKWWSKVYKYNSLNMILLLRTLGMIVDWLC